MSWGFLYVLGSFASGILFSGILASLFAKRWISHLEKRKEEKINLIRHESQTLLRFEERRIQQEFLSKKHQLELAIDEDKRRLKSWETELKELQQSFSSQHASLEDRLVELKNSELEINRKRINLENIRQLYRKRLIQIANISPHEAQRLLKDEIRKESENEIRILRNDLLKRPLESIELEAKRILIDSLQRLSGMPSSNLSAAIIKIPNEEIKGRIIGKEGRNIKSFETITGATLLIDETPGVVMVSSFDPVRRKIAQLALEQLIQDGRIHPANIEETVNKIHKQMETDLLLLGESALLQLGLDPINQDITSLLGKLYYRLSNNQNTLEHSIEVAQLSAMLASELGFDPQLAKACGIYHDLGKAITQDYDNSHAAAAAQLLHNYGENPIVVNAVASSHNEVPPESVYAEILKVADAISATRPGVRCESADSYFQRIKVLEDIAKSFDGIEDAYAIQAGKEIRVIVNPEQYSDTDALGLAARIRKNIEDKLSFPGKIKVVVIREKRFVETAS